MTHRSPYFVTPFDVDEGEWTGLTWSVLSSLWMVDGPFPEFALGGNPTLAVLTLLSGGARASRLSGVDPALAATGRVAILS